MTKLNQLFLSLFLVVGLAGSALAQTALTQTTLSQAVTTASATGVIVASATGISAPSVSAGNPATVLFVDGEAMAVTAVSGTTISVQRGALGTQSQPHISGAMVLAGPPAAFISGYHPFGSCTNGQGLFVYSPVVDVDDSTEWLCSSVVGKVVPGFGNNYDDPGVTTAVASAAGLVTPSGPLFHITGALAITGFNIPVGFDPKGGGGQICAIPDGTYTTTAANNIALASTAVVSKVMCWTYDGNTAKFYPSY